MSSDDRLGSKGLKRLSLAPGARASPLSSPRTPNSASLEVETSLPSPLGHGRRYAPKRMSSISYYNSANIVLSPTSSTSDSFARSPLPPTIPESAVAASLQGAKGLRRSVSAPKRGRTKPLPDKLVENSSDFVIPGQSQTPPPQTLAEK